MSIEEFLFEGAFPEKYKWSTDYEVAVPLIDAQHKKLFLIFRNLVQSCWQEVKNEAGVQALELMADYIDYHFKAEELFWRLDPTIYKVHRKAHYSFVREVCVVTGRVQRQEDITGELLQFLGDWLLNHVAGMDRDHFRLLREKGVVDPDGFLLQK
jgi:hemerythrin-like metal-binding protein